MTSTLKLFGNDESKGSVSPSPGKSPQEPGTNWDSLRGLTSNAYQPQRSTKLRTAVLATLLVVALGFLGLVLHNHMPTLVSFGEELSETVHRLASGTPTPSTATHEATVQDVRSPRSKHGSSHARVPDAQPDQAYDSAFHPFYATAVVGGRRVSLVSNNSVILLDVASGTWKLGSEAE